MNLADQPYDHRIAPFADEATYRQRLEPGQDKYYHYLRGLVQVLQPKTVVELGTCQGGSALFMLLDLPEDGTLTTIDVAARPEFLASCMDDPRLRLVEGSSTDPALPERLGLRDVDLLFVDTDHTCAQVAAELAKWLPLVRPGGVIAFDDVHMNDMDDFWDAFDLPKVDCGTQLHWSGFGVAMKEA
ncbi:MAG: class I SAM-dependent methyltransferase [Armatimonadetes bacterium]|nr:class I SAM-dependent methyltransferase [Armatimonadota bacterium]